MYHLNFRGFNSKKSSFESILNSLDKKPNFLNIVESHMLGNNKLKIPGYETFARNRKDKSQGGVASRILESESINCVNISEGKDSNEYIITRHN